MELLFLIIAILVILFVFLGSIALVGHAIWLIVAGVIRGFSGESKRLVTLFYRCPHCNSELKSGVSVCLVCGVSKPSGITVELLKDLAATARQLDRFQRSGLVDNQTLETLRQHLESERLRLLVRAGPGNGERTSSVPAPSVSPFRQPPASVTDSTSPAENETIEQPPSVIVTTTESVIVTPTHVSAVSAVEVTATQPEIEEPPVERSRVVSPPSPPRKPLTEVIAAFMEESNIRWGEIIGGLLIIGCSTALVVSLWAEISRIPVLKFLIFTTVTATLFGVGLYTEHRWKLPTTSRGILTIATLLVPLNFLAIAAVSGGTLPPDLLVIVSELVAPAVFLCLVYFAGRVLTPAWPHLLTAGVLGSSIGQLLVRHFSGPDVSPSLLIGLGAFPVVCYVASAAWMLRETAKQPEINEPETTSIFITLGSLTFAAVLPFGLLLYKGGPIAMTMMYLAPLVSLGGLPALAIGTILWRRVGGRELLAQRTTGTALAILGTLMVLLGMILAWPNPASIVPAALLNFVVFTVLAVWLEIPAAHLIASLCLGLASLVLFHVVAGHVSWRNLRVTSLLDVSISSSSGQALSPLFVLFLIASEWLRRKGRKLDSRSYLGSTLLVAILSLCLLGVFGLGIPGDPDNVSFIFGLYSLGVFWIAATRNLSVFGWIGSGLLLAALAQACAQWLGVPFPWQTALLLHATLCAVAALVCSRYSRIVAEGLTRTLNRSALISSFLVVLCLVQAGSWETTVMQAERVMWLAGIWLGLLWLNRQRGLFNVFQIALTCGIVISIKAMLQQYDWYAYLPHAFIHPWSLQIQGTALLLICLAWTTLRFWVRKVQAESTGNWVQDAWRMLDAPAAFDRVILWLVLGAFSLLSAYGAWSGIAQELTAAEKETHVWNIAGFPHELAFGIGSWILLGLLLMSMLLNFRERRNSFYALGAVAALATVPPLLAGRWEAELATASAWRWLGAGLLIAASVPLWYRDRLKAWFKSNPWLGIEGATRLPMLIRWSILGLTVLPLFALTAYPALRAIYYMPVHGPAAGIFFLLDTRLLYGGPLVLVALTLIGYAVREKLPTYAFAGGLFFNLTVSIVYLLSVVAANASMDRVVVAHTIQLNAIAGSLFALVWLSMHDQWMQQLDSLRAAEARRLLGIQIASCLILNALIILPVAIKLIARPDLAGIGTSAAGGVRGWFAFGFALVAATWFSQAYRKQLQPSWIFGALLAATCLLAFAAAPLNPTLWTGFHTLIIGSVLTTLLMLLLKSLPSWLAKQQTPLAQRLAQQLSGDWQWDCVLFATAGGLVAVFLSLRAQSGEPSTAWWTIAPLLAMAGVAAAIHWQTLRRIYLYASGILFSAAALIWWKSEFPWSGPLRQVEVAVVSLCLSSIILLVFELRARKLIKGENRIAFSFHNLTALTSLIVMSWVALVRIAFAELGDALVGPVLLDWFAVGSLILLLVACLWDARASHSLASLYIAALLMIALALEQFHLPAHRLLWAETIALALFSLFTSAVWHWREEIMRRTDLVRIPRRIDEAVRSLRWLTVFNVASVSIVTLLAYGICLTSLEGRMRMTAAIAVIGQFITFALMAEGTYRAHWQRAAVFVFLIGTVFLGWSWLTPGNTGTWLNRAVIVMVEMFLFTGIYSLTLEKGLRDKPEWTRAVRACVPWIVGAGGVGLGFTLCTEIFYQINFGAVRLNPISLVAIGLTLASAIIVCVLFALSPKHDPLNLSEKGRMKYVYAAEVMLALLFMHARLTMPWLFGGLFDDYWPLVVMAIAYLGVIASEALRRRKVLVLARPIERTGAFLPLLPVLGFWVAQSRVDYSILLFLVGGVYGGLSILRRSFLFGVLAAIAGNGGLWYLLHRTQNYGLLQHPQLWLIPVALSILLAAYLNRKQFSEEEMTGVRYFSLLMIYASSTADIFVNGVADSPWLPLILAALSLCGVFAGISLRIRGLLLMGSVFLLLAIITMIYYASVNLGWTWLWYVAGIVTGATIIFMFAVFEKKRTEVLRVVDGLKEWES